MTTTNNPPRIVQICRVENVNAEILLALGNDGLVYESVWDSDRQRYHWTNCYDPLPFNHDPT